ncbi:hypothetical protein IKE84_00175 [Candidatus Saccharibacteria bacterium]|nr:hypothetical protein [Candidatus Saccharibacteria bacterium]
MSNKLKYKGSAQEGISGSSFSGKNKIIGRKSWMNRGSKAHGNGLSLKGNQRWVVSVVVVFLMAFVSAFVASSVFAPQSITNADTLFFNIEGTDYSTSVSSADNIVMDISATPDGALAVAHDAVKIVTDNPDGYDLYFSMDQLNDYDTTHPGNALYKDGISTESNFLSPTTGTTAAPTALADNTWGFAVLGGNSREAGIPDTFANFDEIYVDSNGESSTGESGKALISTNKFAQAPLRSSAIKVKSSESATPATGDTFNVYYGAKANLAMDSGQYVGVVNYFAVPDSSVSTFDKASVYPTSLSPIGGQDVTIVTSLHTNYAFSNSDVTVTLTKKDDTTKTGTCTVNSITTDTGNVTIRCTSPALIEGTYTVNTSIPLYDKSYENEVTYVSPTPTFWNITYMQEMTTAVCSTATTPSNTAQEEDTNGSHAGSSAYVPTRVLYDWRGKDGTGSITNKVAPSSSNAQTYTIRKLADGNCWMTENLNLPLYKNYTTPGMNKSSSLTAQPVEVSQNGKAVTTSRTDAVYGNITSAGIWTPVKASNLTNNDNTYALNGNTAYNIGNTGDAAAWNNIWYYSWSAATAGSGKSDMVTSSGDAGYSICPIGWKLPTNYTNSVSTSAQKSWGSLLNTYGINPANHSTTSEYQILEAFPFNLPRAGYFLSGAFQNNGRGYWWSSTAYSTATYAYHLDFGTTLVSPQGRSGKYNGFNVRCVSV